MSNINITVDEIMQNERDSKHESNIKTKTIGVATNNNLKAFAKFEDLKQYYKDDIEYYINSPHSKLIRFYNGIEIKWIKINETLRGYRLDSVIVDRDILINDFHNIIFPLLNSSKENLDDIVVYF